MPPGPKTPPLGTIADRSSGANPRVWCQPSRQRRVAKGTRSVVERMRSAAACAASCVGQGDTFGQAFARRARVDRRTEGTELQPVASLEHRNYRLATRRRGADDFGLDLQTFRRRRCGRHERCRRCRGRNRLDPERLGRLRNRHDAGTRIRFPELGDQLDHHLGRTCLNIAELGRGRVGQVDQPVVQERPTIVDPYHHTAPIGDVRHPNVARDRQGRVRGGHPVHVVALAARRGIAVVAATIPGRDATHLVGLEPRHRPILAPEDDIGPTGARQHRLRTGHGIRNGSDVGRRIAARAIVEVVAAAATTARPRGSAIGRPATTRRGAAAGPRAGTQQQCHGQSKHQAAETDPGPPRLQIHRDSSLCRSRRSRNEAR
jgi:hypothetical protein